MFCENRATWNILAKRESAIRHAPSHIETITVALFYAVATVVDKCGGVSSRVDKV